MLLIERFVGHDDPLRHGFACDHLLSEFHQLRTEERVAFHDVVEFPVRERLHAVVRGVDGHDLNVDAGFLARRFDRLGGAESHVVVRANTTSI